MGIGRFVVSGVLVTGLMAAFSAAPPAMAVAPEAQPTTLTVEWPTAPLPWNEVAYLAVRVSPAQAGRVVRLDITGQGGPGFSALARKRTDASGTARLPLFTLCPDMPCRSMIQTYRVVVPASGDLSAARARGTVRVVVPPGGY